MIQNLGHFIQYMKLQNSSGQLPRVARYLIMYNTNCHFFGGVHQAPKSSHSYCLMSLYILLVVWQILWCNHWWEWTDQQNLRLKCRIKQLPERLHRALRDYWLTLMLGPNLHHVIKEPWSPTHTQVSFWFWVSPLDIFDQFGLSGHLDLTWFTMLHQWTPFWGGKDPPSNVHGLRVLIPLPRLFANCIDVE